MKVIMIPNANPPYNLRKMSPAYGGQEFVGWTEDELVQHVLARRVASGSIPPGDDSYHIVEEEDLPTDYYFFDAWEWSGSAVAVNMPKARAIHMDAIRLVRNAELTAKDITFMRAVEAGDTDAQATIATEKQVLRDIPQTFDLATDVDTTEELKAKWPTELPERE